jgi:hypothetical protein
MMYNVYMITGANNPLISKEMEKNGMKKRYISPMQIYNLLQNNNKNI